MVKKIISFVLVALMVMCIVPGVALADMPDECKYGTCAHVAAIGTTHFNSIREAVNEANNGDTIVVTKDHAIDCNTEGSPIASGLNALINADNKSVTVDLNGKKLTGTVNRSGDFVLFSSVKGGHLTLKDSVGNGSVVLTATSTFGQMMLALADSYLTVESGYYEVDSLANEGSLIYSSSNETVTIAGGSFKLGNVGTLSNGSPWIFNARGQNIRHIFVNGGTFNDDILHQFYPFEVSAPKEKALKKNDDGTWTMVDAVAWVNEQEWSSAWYTNEVGYATLEEAIAAANKNTSNIGDDPGEVTNTVTLLQDCVVNDTLNVSEDMTIALNGKEIIWKDIGENDPLFNVAPDTTLKIPGFNPHVYGNEIPNNTANDDVIEGGTGGKQFNISRTPGTYTITWMSEGAQFDKTQQTYGEPLKLPASNPVKPSATFIGWFAEDGVQVNEGDTFLSEDATYYARFRENPAPISSGSGISVTYNGGNSFSTSKPDVPTSVEIDNMPVSFTGNGSSFTVSDIPANAKWVTVRWNSISVTTNFTPDGAYLTEVLLPKTGDVSFWAAIAEFLGF